MNAQRSAQLQSRLIDCLWFLERTEAVLSQLTGSGAAPSAVDLVQASITRQKELVSSIRAELRQSEIA